MTEVHQSWSPWLEAIHHPEPASRKGQNGKAVIIGGSDLFHAASQWSFRAASRWLDMLFYASTLENNEIIRQAKIAMSDGVVVRRSDLPEYLLECQAALIGPGMRRDIPSRFSQEELASILPNDLHEEDWENDTLAITASLLNFTHQKQTSSPLTWVIDAGALQTISLEWLPESSVLTPHSAEFESLLQRWSPDQKEEILHEVLRIRQLITQGSINPAEDLTPVSRAVEIFTLDSSESERLTHLSKEWKNACILLKGPIDIVITPEKIVAILGGNAGLTKGGTGDVLSGLLLGFVATSDIWASTVMASALIKQAGHDLFLERQEMFNSSDVVEQIPRTLGRVTPSRGSSEKVTPFGVFLKKVTPSES